VLSDHGLVEVDMSSQEQIESRGYSIHGCVHSWVVYVLNQEWDDDLAKLALKFVGSHVSGKESAKWWLTQRRLLQHAARCSHVVLNGMVTDDGMEWASHNLGLLYADQGKLDEAEKMYQRALQGMEKAWGPDHTSTLSTVNNLGNLYKSQGKLDEAEKMYQRALQGKEKAWGPDHTSTLNTVSNLGVLYADQGKLDEAEKMYQRALQGMEKAWGPDHTSTLSTVYNLGNLYEAQGKLGQAEKMYQRALQGMEKAWAQIIHQPFPQSTTWAFSTNPRVSWMRRRRCTSGHCKERRRHWAQIIHQPWTRSTTWAFSTNPRASWTRPRRCTSGHCEDRYKKELGLEKDINAR
jgi:tetratricopeptide (TPR) repeat protein